MKEYMLIFRNGEAPVTDPQKDAATWQSEMAKWRQWMDNLSAQGFFISGGRLSRQDVKVVRGAKKTTTDGPFTEGKEIVGGYMMLRANDLSHATTLAGDCPLLARGGIVEIGELIPAGNN